MDIRHQHKFNGCQVLAAIALAIGTIGVSNTSAVAVPNQDSMKLAQVGIRSRVNAPIPLNLRPRTHIPLPESNYSNYSRPSRNHYRDRDYSCYEGHHDDCNINHRRRHRHYHNDPAVRLRDRRNHRYSTHRKRRSHGNKVIIFNAPGKLGNYGNRNSYIRIIGQ